MSSSSSPLPWEPSSAELWLDAADASSITHSSNAISQWSDKSGNGNHATQGTTANRPTLGTNNIEFDGSTNHFIASTFVLENAHSIYVVAKSDSDGYRRILNANGYYFLGNGNGDNNFTTLYGTSNWQSTGTSTNTPALSVADTSILVAVSNGTNVIPYHNGTAQNSRSSSMEGPAPAGVTIGKHANSSSQYWDGHIAEIIIFNTNQTDADREKVEGYLAHKWGLTSDLPLTHPHKTTPPNADDSVPSSSSSPFASQPFALNGYYPLYIDAPLSNIASPNNSSHSHTFAGYSNTFWMPNGVTYYHGDYVEP